MEKNLEQSTFSSKLDLSLKNKNSREIVDNFEEDGIFAFELLKKKWKHKDKKGERKYIKK